MPAEYKGFAKIKNNVGKVVWSTLTLISPTLNTKALYLRMFHKKLDLNNPKTLNQKLLWLKLNRYMKDPLVIQCADKYLVRDYVKACGCEEILNELLGAWDSPEEIDWNSLPEKFAMKWNFGAGFNLICDDKAQLNQQAVVKQFKKWKKSKCWLPHSEMQYKYIPKKIICEKYLNDGQGFLPVDYKVYCFHGKAKFVMACIGRDLGKPKFLFFDSHWNLARINRDSVAAPENYKIEKTPAMEKLFEYAEKLSKPFPFVRADFYILGDRVYFGELTFTPAGALDNAYFPETDLMLGDMIDLSGYINAEKNRDERKK